MINPNEDRPTDWFEELYSASDERGGGIPWANMTTHPDFRHWLEQNELNGEGKTALVIGCGMGDDAMTLASLGFSVTAFDVSPSAISYCKRRFSQPNVDFVVADLFSENLQWDRRFDFVLEIYTIQALPPKYEDEVIARIARYVAVDGQLLVIALVDETERSFQSGPPWLLTPGHRESFEAHGLRIANQYVRRTSDDDAATYVTTFMRFASGRPRPRQVAK